MTTIAGTCLRVRDALKSSRASASCAVAVCCASSLLCAAPALAQSQGRVVRDGTTIWRTTNSVVATIVKAGTLLDVTARSENWYEVIIPEALGGHGERGLIALPALQLDPATAEPPFRRLRGSRPLGRQARESPVEQPRAAAHQTQKSPTGLPLSSGQTRAAFKGFLSLNSGYQLTSNPFNDSGILRGNSEDGRMDTSYSVKSGPGFAIAGGIRVWRQSGIGISVSRFSRSVPTTFTGSIPHPFFFNQPRSVSSVIGGLKRQELELDVQARGTFALGRRMQVTLFGGPSVFELKQDAVTDFAYVDAYPYDQATFTEAQTGTAIRWKLGVNGGGDVAFFFTRQVGVGFSTTFSAATIDLPSVSGGTFPVKVGGTQAGLGLRLRF